MSSSIKDLSSYKEALQNIKELGEPVGLIADSESITNKVVSKQLNTCIALLSVIQTQIEALSKRIDKLEKPASSTSSTLAKADLDLITAKLNTLSLAGPKVIGKDKGILKYFKPPKQ
nr:P2 [Andraeanum bacilliform virus]